MLTALPHRAASDLVLCAVPCRAVPCAGFLCVSAEQCRALALSSAVCRVPCVALTLLRSVLRSGLTLCRVLVLVMCRDLVCAVCRVWSPVCCRCRVPIHCRCRCRYAERSDARSVYSNAYSTYSQSTR